MSSILRRTIHPEVRVIDANRGTVEYIASSQSLDSYGEVIDARGWQFNRFQRNAPFVDSHNYDSIDCLLGKVIDYKVSRGQLVETVQWAIDVPANTLAQKGFAMTQAGYLKAVSVGFIPLKIARPSDPDWKATCEDLGMGDLENSIRCVYQEQEQLELSACCIGANPDCVAKARSAGIIEDADLLKYPQWLRALESIQPSSRRSYSFPTNPNPKPATDMKKNILDSINALIGVTSGPTVKEASDALESARRGQSESELYRASALTRYAMARERRITEHECAVEILSDTLIREYLEALPRYLSGVAHKNNDLVRKSLTPSGAFGGAMLPIDVSTAIFDLILINSAARSLGWEPMSAMQTKFAQATANPTAVVIPPSLMGATIPADTALTGSSLTPEAATFAVLLPISNELLADEKANLSLYLLTRFSQALSGAIDFCAFAANGAVDTTNGGMTGIWNDNTISTVYAAQGNTTIANLARADFLAVVNAVAPAALQRECKWFISPSAIAQLMTLVDSEGRSYLLKTPSETGDGTWRLVGFEVVWTAQAPFTNAAGQTFAAFGHGPSYLVGIREELEVMLNNSLGFSSNQMSFRAISRGLCQTRAASGLAKLALAQA